MASDHERDELERLRTRLDAVEAHEEIRQLAARYAQALDSRDIAGMAALFIDDVKTADGGAGREALAQWLDGIMRPYRITFHLIGNHIIDLVDDDHATGVVYCRPEHEVDGEWIVMPMQYWDRYEKRDGRWYFRSRSPHVFYAADIHKRPQQTDDRFHFPGNPMITRADLPERWESWQEFWSSPPEN